MAQAFVALGSNLDAPEEQVRAALRALDALPGTRLSRASRLYRTPPWGILDQPWFVNAAAQVRTELDPQQLMRELQALEVAAGRQRSAPRWGPRRLDLDLLLFDQLCLDTRDLQLPHPRLAERAFVLVPLLELDPALALPDGRRLMDLLAQVDTAGIEPLP
jgi:2-amino-4-hydroxy-6-hydroxymethyldihydropteridine diphosphokinase